MKLPHTRQDVYELGIKLKYPAQNIKTHGIQHESIRAMTYTFFYRKFHNAVNEVFSEFDASPMDSFQINTPLGVTSLSSPTVNAVLYPRLAKMGEALGYRTASKVRRLVTPRGP